jgi:hypothetical protein
VIVSVTLDGGEDTAAVKVRSWRLFHFSSKPRGIPLHCRTKVVQKVYFSAN